MHIDELIINLIPKKTFSKILENIFFLEKYLRQPSMDFDVCNLLSSGDVIYKECWWHWHKLVTDLFYDFVSILLVANFKMPSNWKISII